MHPIEDPVLLLPDKLPRKPYFIRFLVFLLVVVGGGACLEMLPKLQPWSVLVWVTVALTYKTIGLDIPRARDVGWSPWALVAQLIPGLGLVVLILLFTVPTDTFQPSSKRREVLTADP